jgi:hypothetical protein
MMDPDTGMDEAILQSCNRPMQPKPIATLNFLMLVRAHEVVALPKPKHSVKFGCHVVYTVYM